MKKISFILVFFIFSTFSFGKDGMLVPTLLEAFEDEMQSMGMKISAEDIYSVNQASIKDAIFHFGGGCTASIISDQGLLLTNHHCGYHYIYEHTTVENNIAKNGFFAQDLSEELKNPGLTATRMVRIENVTEQVLEGTEGIDDAEEQQKIMSNIARIKSDAINGTHYEADIKPFDFGNSYFLLVKETFDDVRLVGTPPKSVGKFGGDQDNWVWPRHTGDFSLFRIYTNKDNEPAAYSEDNVPYTPIHHLPVSIKDREKDEFSMVFGFPGQTFQHTISTELEFIIDKLRPAQIKMRDLSLSVINRAMEDDEQTEINYATKQSRISNAWKKWKGQIEGLKNEGALAKKVATEKAYVKQAEENEEWKVKYAGLVNNLRVLSEKYNDADFVYNMYIEYVYVGAEMFERARKIEGLMDLYEKGETEKLAEEIEKMQASAAKFYEKYDKEIDQQVFALQSAYYQEKISEKYLPEGFKTANLEKLTKNIYSKSFLVNQDQFLKTLKNFEKYAKRKIKKDPGYQFYDEIKTIFFEDLLNDMRTYYATKESLMKTFVAGKYEMYPDDKHWPDANSTLRLSYGKVEGSAPTDGMKYTSHTTIDGVIAKYNTGDPAYELLPRMLELYEQKNWGDYAQDGELWVCFTSSNHTTGGNSGSPIINGDGYLIGANFDRSWESTMSDYMFDGSRCRNISVDARYILWMIDVYGEAPHLVKEMTVIK